MHSFAISSHSGLPLLRTKWTSRSVGVNNTTSQLLLTQLLFLLVPLVCLDAKVENKNELPRENQRKGGIKL